MQGGRWLAIQAHEIERVREGALTTVAPQETDTMPTYSAPSRYPILWRLSIGSLVDLAGAGGLTVDELIDHAASRPLVRQV